MEAPGRDYSIFDSDEEYGEYADSFGRSGDSWMGNQVNMGPMPGMGGRAPSGIMGQGNMMMNPSLMGGMGMGGMIIPYGGMPTNPAIELQNAAFGTLDR